ncbi:cell division protein ZapC [Paraglaciecola aquimarina]|uniref:Cell division protein ZapC n=2 Tax=Paraglaciecola algarum TaxID=3050085 RepID=A0ABS9D5P0_9ALTE|nr:cell division protein ZapC [Paraglaciecola sp. G1-23]
MSNWFWFTENSQLMLSMGSEWQCTTAYGQKHIVDLPSVKKLFSLRDTESYLSMANYLQSSGANLTDAQLTHTLINATAALQFHKPISPKSWFFDEIDNPGSHHKLARINNIFGSGVVLVLLDEGVLATCMLISNQIQLNENKQLQKFDLVKVAKNRLEPYLAGQCCQLSA